MSWDEYEQNKRSRALCCFLRSNQSLRFRDGHGNVAISDILDGLRPFEERAWTAADVDGVVHRSIRRDGSCRFVVTRSQPTGEISHVRTTDRKERARGYDAGNTPLGPTWDMVGPLPSAPTAAPTAALPWFGRFPAAPVAAPPHAPLPSAPVASPAPPHAPLPTAPVAPVASVSTVTSYPRQSTLAPSDADVVSEGSCVLCLVRPPTHAIVHPVPVAQVFDSQDDGIAHVMFCAECLPIAKAEKAKCLEICPICNEEGFAIVKVVVYS